MSNCVAEWKRKVNDLNAKEEQKKFTCATDNSRKKLGGVNKLCFIRVKTISRIVDYSYTKLVAKKATTKAIGSSAQVNDH